MKRRVIADQFMSASRFGTNKILQVQRSDELIRQKFQICFAQKKTPRLSLGQVHGQNYSLSTSSCTDLIRFRGHQKIFDLHIAAGRITQPLGKFHRNTALTFEDERQMRFGAAGLGGESCLVDVLVRVHPDGKRVSCVHAADFAIGKVYLSRITLLAGNGHAQLIG